MKLEIYSKDGQLKLTVTPESNNAESLGIQEESTLALSFTGFACVPLEVYDYAEFQGRRYWVTERYVPKMNARKEWAYSVSLFGVEGLAAQTLMVNPSDDDNPVLTLTAPAREHAALIVANLNRRMGTTDWKVGEVVVSEYIDIEYTGKYASDALSELSEAAGTEWWFDGMTLNISRCEFGEPIPLSYGNGLLGGISRTTADGVKFFTRLFPVGSSRNIDLDYYGHARLQLPDGAKYVEQDTQLGIIEHYEQAAFEGIYPRRVGQVGTVRHEEATGDDGEPFTIWYFTDPDIPFDPNQYEIGGLVKRVTFQSGELRGREFEVNYDTEKKEFEIITQWPYDDDLQLPSEPLIPASGDEYILWNIRMPESYYSAAEQEYKETVDQFMADNRKDVSVWQAPTDFTVIERRGLDLRPGQRVRLESAEAFPDTGFRETRIVSISRSIIRPGSMTLKMSDVLSTGRISRIESNIASVERLTKQVSSEFPDLIRSWEETPASDTTVYTSRKSEREFLNKRRGGTVEENVTFDKDVAVGGAVISKDFRQGDFSGSGSGMYRDENGNAVIETDLIKARKGAVFNTAIINQVTFQVGATVFSNGGCEITRVEELDDVYRCYYDTKEGRRLCGLVVDDQVRCQQYDPSQNTIVKYYWRLVVAVGDDYVDLSKTDVDGTGVPEEGDEIAQFGHRTDKTRQGATIIDPKDGSSVVVYSEINSYSLVKKNFVGLGTNPQTGRPYLFCYGDLFIGDRELKDQFLTYQIKEGQSIPQLLAQMNIMLGAGSSGLTNLTEWAEKQLQIDNAEQTAIDAQDTANTAQQTAEDAARKAQEAKDYINSTLPEELADIHRKIDGVVEGWYYPYTPTLDNEPAVSWIRDGEQDKHRDDTFTNIQEYVDNETTPDAGKSWRWIHDGSTWKWTPIADSDAVRALLLAAKAQDTADGKRRTFVVQPTTPYDVGDMWSQGSNGDLMRCIKSRASGAFDASDWDKASKYTDDTVALEAKQAAQTAQQTADTARDEAQKVKEQQEIFASDSYISPMEKTALKQQQADIQAEYGEIISRAGQYSISTAAYASAYTAAKNALAKYTASTPENIPVESDYANIAAYYTARQTILDAIAAAAKQYVDDVEFSSINLIDGSESVTVDNGLKAIVIPLKVKEGDELSISISEIAILAGAPEYFSTVIYDRSYKYPYSSTINMTAEIKKGVFKINSNAGHGSDANLLLYAGPQSNTKGNIVRYDNIMLVRGNKPCMTWAPSVNDQKQAAIDGVQVGGVNLLNGSYSGEEWTGIGSYEDGVFSKGTSGVNEVFMYSPLCLDLEAGKEYTLSFYSKMTSNVTSAEVYVLFSGVLDDIIQRAIPKTEDWSYNVFTFTPKVSGVRLLRFDNNGSSDGNIARIYITKPQVEEGNKATSWNKSPADVQAEIDKVQQAVSDLDYLKEVFPNAMLDVNGVVLAQLMGVKSSTAEDAAVIAGFYGGSDETLNAAGFKDPTHGILMMFAGAENVQSVASAKTRVYGDGSLFTQMLYASGGKIGGFEIGENWLESSVNSDEYSLNLSAAAVYLRCANTNYDNSVQLTSFPSPSLGYVNHRAMSISVNRKSTDTSNIYNAGIAISVDGYFYDSSFSPYRDIAGNHALFIEKGNICGLRVNQRVVTLSSSQDVQLTGMDTAIIAKSGTGNIILPKDPEDGQLIMTKTTGGNYNLKVGTTGHYINDGRTNKKTTWDVGTAGSWLILIWSESELTWNAAFTNAN